MEKQGLDMLHQQAHVREILVTSEWRRQQSADKPSHFFSIILIRTTVVAVQQATNPLGLSFSIWNPAFLSEKLQLKSYVHLLRSVSKTPYQQNTFFSVFQR